jgi:hypothetical protein
MSGRTAAGWVIRPEDASIGLTPAPPGMGPSDDGVRGADRADDRLVSRADMTAHRFPGRRVQDAGWVGEVGATTSSHLADHVRTLVGSSASSAAPFKSTTLPGRNER